MIIVLFNIVFTKYIHGNKLVTLTDSCNSIWYVMFVSFKFTLIINYWLFYFYMGNFCHSTNHICGCIWLKHIIYLKISPTSKYSRDLIFCNHITWWVLPEYETLIHVSACGYKLVGVVDGCVGSEQTLLSLFGHESIFLQKNQYTKQCSEVYKYVYMLDDFIIVI